MKVSKEKMVLHLPFDEEAGSAIAYNYAPNRTTNNDAVISGDCEFTEDAVFGNALQMNGDSADVSVNENIIDFSGEFTLSAFIKSSEPEITLAMNFSAGGQSQSHTVNIEPLRWYFVAIQRVLIDNIYHTRFVVDYQAVYNQPELGQPVGFSISDNSIPDTSTMVVDELKAWNRGLSLSEIFALQRETDDVEYYVDGENFKLFGVEVSKADGLVDALERKEPLRMDWDNMHGEVIDLQRPHWQRREITLECFIVASSNTAFVKAVQRFLAAFEKKGTQRFTCEYAGSVRPLEYDVYRNDRVEIDKTWNDKLMVGTFTLALIEPQPVKMVLKHICQSANTVAWFQCQTYKSLFVSWGDENTACTVNDSDNRDRSTNLKGIPVKVAHTYAAAGEYDIVIHGNIEDIVPNTFSTNCIVIWSRL